MRFFQSDCFPPRQMRPRFRFIPLVCRFAHTRIIKGVRCDGFCVRTLRVLVRHAILRACAFCAHTDLVRMIASQSYTHYAIFLRAERGLSRLFSPLGCVRKRICKACAPPHHSRHQTQDTSSVAHATKSYMGYNMKHMCEVHTHRNDCVIK